MPCKTVSMIFTRRMVNKQPAVCLQFNLTHCCQHPGPHLHQVPQATSHSHSLSPLIDCSLHTLTTTARSAFMIHICTSNTKARLSASTTYTHLLSVHNIYSFTCNMSWETKIYRYHQISLLKTNTSATFWHAHLCKYFTLEINLGLKQ